jgi:hypothetical protein
MYATHSHGRVAARGEVHAHGGVARKRASLSPLQVLCCSIGAIVLLANARRDLFPKVLLLTFTSELDIASENSTTEFLSMNR